MLQTPDGHGRLEFFEYIHPDAIETEPTLPNDIGMHRVAFSVDDIDDALAIAAKQGCHPLRGVAKRISKQFSSIFAGTDLEAWLREQDIVTITLVGYMTNNCVIASAAAAEPLGFDVEVLSDATGAIDLTNDAGTAPARQIHETLMTLLHSNWAAVTDTETWTAAVRTGAPLPKSDLITSAAQGRNAR